MRAVIQRTGYASVNVDGKIVGEIGKGIMALVGFEPTDDEKVMDYMLDKTVNLRIFEDEAEQAGLKKVKSGIFQADMKVELLNDGPITILLDSDRNF